VEPKVEVVGITRAELGGSAVKAINGTYTGCASRSGAWSARVSGNDPLDHDALSVITHDTACQLTLTEVVADQHYLGTMALAASWPSGATAYAPDGGATAFHANARLDSAAFESDFTISLVYSADVASTSTPAVGATYATVTSTVQASSVPVPNYTASVTANGLALTLQMDVLGIVLAASGSVSLTDGSQTGEKYVVDPGLLSAVPTYATVAAAYALGVKHTIAGADPQVPASQLGLLGLSLGGNVTRTIIVAHTVGVVTSFQLIKVTLHG